MLTLPQNLTLEELDSVFSVGNRKHFRYYLARLPWYLRKYVLRRKVEPYPELFQLADDDDSSAASEASEASEASDVVAGRYGTSGKNEKNEKRGLRET